MLVLQSEGPYSGNRTLKDVIKKMPARVNSFWREFLTQMLGSKNKSAMIRSCIF